MMGNQDAAEDFGWWMKLACVRSSLQSLVDISHDRITSDDCNPYNGQILVAIGCILSSCGIIEDAVKFGSIHAQDLPIESLQNLGPMIQKLIISEESLGKALPALKRISKSVESVAATLGSDCAHTVESVCCILYRIRVYELALRSELSFFRELDGFVDNQETEFSQLCTVLDSVMHPFVLMSKASNDLFDETTNQIVPPDAWDELVSIVDTTGSVYNSIMKAKLKLSDQINSKFPTMEDCKRVLCDGPFMDTTILGCLNELQIRFLRWVQNLPSQMTVCSQVPAWTAHISDLQQKLQRHEQLVLQIGDLERRLSNQILSNSRKDEEIGQMQLTVEKLERSTTSFGEAQQHIHRLEKELQEMTELKEKYEKGLEMMHADFEESNQEYEQLSKQYQALQQHLKQKSPTRIIHSNASDTVPVDVFEFNVAVNSRFYHSVLVARKS
jgi:uncharacterized protein YukE